MLRDSQSSLCVLLICVLCSPARSVQSSTGQDTVLPSREGPWGAEDSPSPPTWSVSHLCPPQGRLRSLNPWLLSRLIGLWRWRWPEIFSDANIQWVRTEQRCPSESQNSSLVRAELLPVTKRALPGCVVLCACTHLLWIFGLAPTCCSSPEFYISKSGIQCSSDSRLVHTAKPWQKLLNALYKYFLFNDSGQRCWVEEPN